VPFTTAMQKITARKWKSHKEKFIDYVNDKLDLMQCLDLTVMNQINLLATGVKESNLRIVALSMVGESLENFIERMRDITDEAGIANNWRDSNQPNGYPKEDVRRCNNCRKVGHLAKNCRSGKVTAIGVIKKIT